jgi:hypothetical protein
MHLLIDKTQTAYIEDKSIHDNIVCAHKILFQVRKAKTKDLLLKLDFTKAFDRIN